MVCYVMAFFSFQKKQQTTQEKQEPHNFVSSPDLAVREYNMKNRHKDINATLKIKKA